MKKLIFAVVLLTSLCMVACSGSSTTTTDSTSCDSTHSESVAADTITVVDSTTVML